MKLNFSKLAFQDLSGTPINANIGKLLGNAIYVFVRDLRYLKLAERIYGGEEIDFSDDELKAIEGVINNESVGFAAFIRQGLLDYIKTGDVQKLNSNKGE